MKHAAVQTLLLLASTGPLAQAANTRNDASPVSKVLELMNAMLAKGKAEKQAERVKFSAFSQWCQGEAKRRSAEVQENSEEVELQTAKIHKAEKRVRRLDARVKELQEDVGRWEVDQKAAQTVRDRETQDYQATTREYSDTMQAIDKAMQVIKDQDQDTPQGQEAFLQISRSVVVPEEMKGLVGLFFKKPVDLAESTLRTRLEHPLTVAHASLAQQPEELSVSAPEANAYESQSGGILDMLSKLKGQFASKKDDLDKEEMQAEMNFQKMMQTLKINLDQAQDEINKRTTSQMETSQEKSEAEGNLDEAQGAYKENSEYLKDMTDMCRAKSEDYEKTQSLRRDEVEALQKAIEIVGGDSVSGAADRNLPSFFQLRRTAYAQLRAKSVLPVQQQLSEFLQQRASQYNSQLLSLVAVRMGTDPFDKVKKMIRDLISKLMEEARVEIEHKGWCDTELTTNQQTRDRKSAEVEELVATVEELQATIAKLAQTIADLSASLKDLADTVSTAQAEREGSKAKHENTIDEAKTAQLAVQQAVRVLREYYAKAAESGAFAQVGSSMDNSDAFGAAFKGQQATSNNILDFLDVVESDFARLESEASTAEDIEQDTHEKFMFESQKDQALKEQEVNSKGSKKVNMESDLHSTQDQLRTVQEQLINANAYYEKLAPTCVDSGITYEERVRRREEELQSLKEAKNILEGTELG